jgi:acyl-CoA synthetase (AMP-forming)/AMP-acid ligase II
LRGLSRRYGDAVALRSEADTLTYRQVDKRSAALAKGLLAVGVGKGTRIGLLLGNNPEWAVAWAAITRMGGIAVPLSTLYRAPELARVIRHADLHGLIAQPTVLNQDFTDLLPKALPSLNDVATPALAMREAPFLRWVVMPGVTSPPAWVRSATWLMKAGEALPDGNELLGEVEAEVHPEDLAVVIYTSGQSAAPKGVTHTQGGILTKTHYVRSMLGFTRETDTEATMPFFWVGGMIMCLFPVLEAGGVVRCVERPGGGPIVIGAVGMQPNPYPDLELFPALGMSETFGPYSWGREWRLAHHPIAPPLDVFEPGVDVAVLNDADQPVAVGDRGAIVVRGPTVTRGLYKVRRDEVFTADGFYRTGDEGLQVDGRIVFVGRLGDMIKSAGANVAPAEVEMELANIPGIARAHVVGLSDPKRGQAVGAAVVPAEGVDVDPAQIYKTLQDRLSSYKVPRVIAVLLEEEIPMTPSRKVRKRDLAQIIRERGVRVGRDASAGRDRS